MSESVATPGLAAALAAAATLALGLAACGGGGDAVDRVGLQPAALHASSSTGT